MNIPLNIWLILAAAGFLNLGALAQENAADLIKAAQKEVQARNYGAATSAFARVLAAPDANASLKTSAHIGIANVLLQGTRPQTAAALAEYDKALALPELPDKDRLNLLSLAAGAHGRLPTPDWDGAVALYEKIAADPSTNNPAKIAALNNLAGATLEKGDIKTANAALQRALALPGLTPAEQVTALRNMGNHYARQADYAAARAAYQKMLAVDTNDQNKVAVDRLMAAAWMAEGQFDKALEIHRQAGRTLEASEVLQKKGDLSAAQAELRKLLADPQAKDGAKLDAFRQLLKLSIQQMDYPKARQDAEAFLPKLMATNAAPAAALLPLLKDAMEKGHYECGAWAAPIVMKAPALPERDALLCRVYLVNALAGQGKIGEARQAAEAAAADAGLSVTNPFRFKLTAAALAATGKPDEMKKALGALKADGLSHEEKAKAILDAGKTAMMAGQYSAARELYTLRQALFVQEPRASYVCEFMDTAPADVGSWLASPLLKDPKKKARLNRKYGSNLALLLETDAATASRGVTADSKETGDTETDFFMACDVNGLHFFFLAADSKVQEVKSGLLSGGSYEGYLAPGQHQPYYTFLIDLPSGSLADGFHTQYPNRTFRQALKINDTVKSATLPTEKGFATYVFYSWDLFYDKLPENGDAWQFDNIRWTRAGGFSWAGSESVHHRSNWGDIVFSGLTPKARCDIKRNLICKAFAKYKLERTAAARGGAIHFWQDPELGDPKFYSTALAPVVARLDEFGKKVTKDMTEADVNLLFEQAVPDWMEFKYKAAELRMDYLSDKLFSNAAQP